MSDMLADGTQWLRDTLRANASEVVDVTCPEGELSDIAAIRGSTRTEQVDETGFRVESRAIDWIVLAADLVFGDYPYTPARGMRITDAAGVTWEAIELGPGVPVAELDPDGREWRIHTKQVPA